MGEGGAGSGAFATCEHFVTRDLEGSEGMETSEFRSEEEEKDSHFKIAAL